MSKTITESEQLLVMQMVSNYMDTLKQNTAVAALCPEKASHLINLGIVSFVMTAAVNLDDILNSMKDHEGYVPLNIHGQKFKNHLDFFMHLLKKSTVKEF